LVLARHWSNRQEVALLGAAVFLATPASMLASALAQVLFPAVARGAAGGQEGRVRAQIDLATRGLVVALIAALGSVALMAPVLLRFIYGERYAGASTLLAILATAVALVSMANGATALLMGGGEQGMRVVAGIQAAGTTIALLTLLFLSPSLGTGGSALGVLVGSAISGLGPLVVVWRRERMRWGGLMFRAALGLALLWCAILALSLTDAPAVADVAGTAVWLSTWGAITWPEIRRLIPGAAPIRRTATHR
jgi:O-antigen/teichoic acid export membrane protein